MKILNLKNSYQMNGGLVNKPSFDGIKLSSSSFTNAKEVALHLKKTGFYCLGCKKLYASNDLNSKIRKFSNFRAAYTFGDREFGTVFLPWSHEVYILARPDYEQFMLPVVKNIDSKAYINLMI